MHSAVSMPAFFYLFSAASADAESTLQSAHDAVARDCCFTALLMHCRRGAEQVPPQSGQAQYLQRGQVRRVFMLHGGV